MNDVVRDPQRDTVNWLKSERIVEEIDRALPKHISADWFLRVAQTAILMKPELAQAERGSLLRELVAVAQLGLVMDPQMGEAWLIIDGQKRVQRRIGYQGLRKLALQSGLVTTLNAQAVYENDQTDIDLGNRPHVHHRINLHLEDRGKKLGCYAVARIAGSDDPVVEWMSWKQIMEHRDRYSQAGKSGPWGDPLAEIEMGRKTVFRRLAKWLPKSPQLADALAQEDRADMRVVSPDAYQPEEPANNSPLAPQIRPARSEAPRAAQPAAREQATAPEPVAEAAQAAAPAQEAPGASRTLRRRGPGRPKQANVDSANAYFERIEMATDHAELDHIRKEAEYERLCEASFEAELETAIHDRREAIDAADTDAGSGPGSIERDTEIDDEYADEQGTGEPELTVLVWPICDTTGQESAEEYPAVEWFPAFKQRLDGATPVDAARLRRTNKDTIEAIEDAHPEFADRCAEFMPR